MAHATTGGQAILEGAKFPQNIPCISFTGLEHPAQVPVHFQHQLSLLERPMPAMHKWKIDTNPQRCEHVFGPKQKTHALINNNCHLGDMSLAIKTA
jgi:hypothetical protein